MSKARDFWDARAREDAMHFVDSRLQYRGGDRDRFWQRGDQDLTKLLDTVGVRIDSGDRVVDIGCGVGRLSRAIAARASSVVGIDVSPEMVQLARSHNEHLQNAEFVVGDGESLDGISSYSADACISLVVFQHIPDPQVTLGYVREIGRVLKPGGWAVFQVSNDAAVHSYRLTVGRRLRAVLGRAPKGMAKPNWAGSSVELGELRAAAQDGGMTVTRIAGEGQQFCVVHTTKDR